MKKHIVIGNMGIIMQAGAVIEEDSYNKLPARHVAYYIMLRAECPVIAKLNEGQTGPE